MIVKLIRYATIIQISAAHHHLHELDLAPPLEAADVAPDLAEAEALVNADRALVEGRDVQHDFPRREAGAPELEPGTHELLAESASGEIRA